MRAKDPTATGGPTRDSRGRDAGTNATTSSRGTTGRQLVATYNYEDDGGGLLYQKQRYEWQDYETANRMKSFRFCVEDGIGGRTWQLGDTPRVLYRLRELTEADPDEVVYYVEGEKCCDHLRALGLVATTAGSAADWRPGFERWLARRDVMILPDADKPGRDHGQRVAAAVYKQARRVRVLELPDLPAGGDIVDFLSAGHTIEKLNELVAASPVWEPGKESAPSAQILELTDATNAETFAREHGKGVRWVPEWGSWVMFDGKRWRKVPVEVLTNLAIKTARGFYAMAAEPAIGTDRAKAFADHARRSESRGRLDAMIHLARGLLIEAAAAFDAGRFIFNCQNGTIDLRSGSLYPHRRADMLTQLAPVTFDSVAPATRWDAFLDRILPDASVRECLRRFVGYCLTGDVSEQVVAFFYGCGANGKTTLLETIMEVFGGYARPGAPDLLLAKRGESHPTEQADLEGARLVVCQEVEEGRAWAERTVKMLTGSDRIKARFMRRDFFTFEPTHKLIVAGNHRPKVRGQDDAIWRRLMLVPFDVTIPEFERDRELKTKLLCEAPAILRWAVRGCAEWQASGLKRPLAVVEATAAYRVDQDHLGRFIEDQCELAAEAFEGTTKLYEAYGEWCKRTGEQPWQLDSVREGLAQRDGIKAHRRNAKRGFMGIRIRQASP